MLCGKDRAVVRGAGHGGICVVFLGALSEGQGGKCSIFVFIFAGVVVIPPVFVIAFSTGSPYVAIVVIVARCC